MGRDDVLFARLSEGSCCVPSFSAYPNVCSAVECYQSIEHCRMWDTSCNMLVADGADVEKV